MNQTNTYIELDGGIDVDEATGEILEGMPGDAIEQFTRLALEADEQRKLWEQSGRIYKLMLKQMGVEDETTKAGRAVLRGRTYRKSTREMFEASPRIGVLSPEKRDSLILKAYSALDPKRLDQMLEDDLIGVVTLVEITSQSRSEWVEVKPLKKQATPLKRVEAS